MLLEMVSRCKPHPLSLSSQRPWRDRRNFDGWRGEFGREGAPPPLKFSPPLKQNNIKSMKIDQFERGTKGVSISNQP
jgi:hypothetical protein